MADQKTKNFKILKNKGSVAAWMGILSDSTKLLPVRNDGALNAKRYLNDILIAVVLPFLMQRQDRGYSQLATSYKGVGSPQGARPPIFRGCQLLAASGNAKISLKTSRGHLKTANR